MTHFDVLIVGSGHGGVQTAAALRHLDFHGSIGIVTAESDLPYERPPLSKDYLAGEKPFESILFHQPHFWAEKKIELVRGHDIIAINAMDRIAVSASQEFGYSKLVWAAGGQPRRLSCGGSHLEGLHTIRTRADVDRLRGELQAANRVVVIGGGYIGLEAAAVLVSAGKQVTVIEALDRPLSRVAAGPISDFFVREHEARGVDFLMNATVTCIEGSSGRVARVLLGDGSTVDADIVIVGIGIQPSVEPLIEAGAESSNGVLVDECCRTNLPDVFAVGDCALHHNPFGPNYPVRVESVQNATDQAMTAAKSIIGQAEPYHATPWFWSHQFDVKLQTVGLNAGYDDFLVRGDASSDRFSVLYFRNERLVALDCVNLVRDYVQGRKLVEQKARFDRVALQDDSVPLKSLVA
ncbi:FAD-dependent oxidoreductase [Sphingomonas daechungensis]|uniref:FAD-dependent oxidoreductase n=1 Tax=Sphingomonas daechungensis TaxID=1176646 RepID=A0ABX6SY56_9SPHN|nr:FAD-dependent oxidoreductase [Sphingomonas daechungensis]QNP42527.1 FAD-dependent oxidoreductase [Sphingomonas daechungensis]